MSDWHPGPGAHWKRSERLVPPEGDVITVRVNGRVYLLSRDAAPPRHGSRFTHYVSRITHYVLRLLRGSHV